MIVGAFVRVNTAASDFIESIWPPRAAKKFGMVYPDSVARVIDGGNVRRIVDIGAGRSTVYANSIPSDVELIGIDVLESHMIENRALTSRIVHDVSEASFPSSAGKVDLATSRMVLEHVRDNTLLAQSIFAALRTGGATVHLFAGRWAVFSLLNRLLPPRIARTILFRLRPASVDVGGFETYYDKTDAHSIRRVYEGAGFSNVIVRLDFQNAQYFKFFVPAYVLMRVYDALLRLMRADRFASYVVLTATKL